MLLLFQLCLISTLLTYQTRAAPGGKRLFIAYGSDDFEEENVFPGKANTRSGRSTYDSSEEIIIEGIKGTINAEDKRFGVNAQGQPLNHQGQNNLQGSTFGANFGQQDYFTNGGSIADTGYANGHKRINTVEETNPSGEFYMSGLHQPLPDGRHHLNNDKQTEKSRKAFFTQPLIEFRGGPEIEESDYFARPHHVNTQPNAQTLLENTPTGGPQIDQQSRLSNEMRLNDYFKGGTPSIGIGYNSEHNKILAQQVPFNSDTQMNLREENQSIERGHTSGQELPKAGLKFKMLNCQDVGNNILDICKLCSTANCGAANYGLTGASIVGGADTEGGAGVTGEAGITGETGFAKAAGVAGGEVSFGRGTGIRGGAGFGEGTSFGNRFGIITAFGGLSNRLGQRLKGIGSILPKYSRSRSSLDANLPQEHQTYPLRKSYYNNVVRVQPNQQVFFRNIPMEKIQTIESSHNIEPIKNILTKEPYINTIHDVVPNRQTFYKNRLTRDSQTSRQSPFTSDIQSRRDFNDGTHLIETDHNILEHHQIMSKEEPYYNIPNCRDIENGVVGICSLCSYGGLYYHLNNNIKCGATNYVSHEAGTDYRGAGIAGSDGIGIGAGVSEKANIDGRFGILKVLGGVDNQPDDKIKGSGSILPKLPGLRSSVDGELVNSEQFGRGVGAGPGGRGYMEVGKYIGGVANIGRPGIPESTGREGILYITTMGRDIHTNTEANNPKASYVYPREGGINSFSTRYDINSGTGTIDGAGIGTVAGNNRGISISLGSGFRGGVSTYRGTGIGEGAGMGVTTSNNRGTGIVEALDFRKGLGTYGNTGIAEIANIGALTSNRGETAFKGEINTYGGAGIEKVAASNDGKVNKIGGGSGITETTYMKGVTAAGINGGTAIGGESGIAGRLGIERGLYTTTLGAGVLKGSDANMGRETYTYRQEASINGFGTGSGINAMAGNSERENISIRSDITGGAGIDAKTTYTGGINNGAGSNVAGAAYMRGVTTTGTGIGNTLGGGPVVGGGATIGGGAVVVGGIGKDRVSYRTTLDGMIHTDSERNMGRGTYTYTQQAGTSGTGAGSGVNSISDNRQIDNISVGSGIEGKVNNYGGTGIAGEAANDAKVIYTGGVGGDRGSNVIKTGSIKDATSGGIGVDNVAGGGIAIGGGAVSGGGLEMERLYTKILTSGAHTGSEGNLGRETYTYRQEPGINSFVLGSGIGTLSSNSQRKSISVGSGIGGGLSTYDGAGIGGGTVIDGKALTTGVGVAGGESSGMRGATKLGIGVVDAVGGGKVNSGTEKIEGESYTTTTGERLYSGTGANMGRRTYTYTREAGIRGFGTGAGIGEGANMAEGASIGAGTGGGASISGSSINGGITSHGGAGINGGTGIGGAAGIGESAYMGGATTTGNTAGTAVGGEANISGGLNFRGDARIKGSSYTTTVGGVYSDTEANIRKDKYIQGTGFGTGVDFRGGTTIHKGTEIRGATSINGDSGITSGAGINGVKGLEKRLYTTSIGAGTNTNTDVNMERGTYIYTGGSGLGTGNDINREIGMRKDVAVYRGVGTGIGASNGGEAHVRRITNIAANSNQGGEAYMGTGNGIGGGYTRREIEIREGPQFGGGTGVGLRGNNDLVLKGFNNYRQAYTIVPL